jgi:transcription termination/antitermination protein NusA
MNSELQSVVEYMEKERGIDRETVIQAIESALVSAAKKGMGPNRDLSVTINRKTFDISAFVETIVVERVTSVSEQLSVRDAQRIKPGAQAGEFVLVPIPPHKLGRIAAQVAKQAIMQKIRQAEKERVFDEYKDRAGDIVSGSVRRFDRNDVVIDLGRAEAFMPSRERVPTEEYQAGDRIRAYVLKVDNESAGPEIILSRTHPDFVRRLFELEVSEIADGTVEIKGIAREAGFRSKIAVVSHDEKVDPVGACVGMKGIRVKNIVRELSGEKIDIVRWHTDVKTFVTNSLAPARLAAIEVDEDIHTVRVTVDPDQLSLAIGKKGQNARLTSKLTGWKIDIQKDEGSKTFEEKVAEAVDQLALVDGVSREHAEMLVKSGFLSAEMLLTADMEDLLIVEGLDQDTAAAIRAAVEKHYDNKMGDVDA